MRFFKIDDTLPLIEPVTLAEAKMQCRISSDVQDSLLSLWIKSAREQAEEIAGQCLISQDWCMSYDVGSEGYPTFPIMFPRSPVSIVNHVYVYGQDDVETEVDLTDFVIDYRRKPCVMFFKEFLDWPAITLRDYNSIQIEYTAGYGATAASVPAVFRELILGYVAWKNENRTLEVDNSKTFMSQLFRRRLWVS